MGTWAPAGVYVMTAFGIRFGTRAFRSETGPEGMQFVISLDDDSGLGIQEL